MSTATTAPTTTKRLVDVLTEDQKASQINDLLAKLEAATTSSEKKKIRRGLRTRGYFLSRQPKPDAIKAEAEANNAIAEQVTQDIIALSVPEVKPKAKKKGKK